MLSYTHKKRVRGRLGFLVYVVCVCVVRVCVWVATALTGCSLYLSLYLYLHLSKEEKNAICITVATKLNHQSVNPLVSYPAPPPLLAACLTRERRVWYTMKEFFLSSCVPALFYRTSFLKLRLPCYNSSLSLISVVPFLFFSCLLPESWEGGAGKKKGPATFFCLLCPALPCLVGPLTLNH